MIISQSKKVKGLQAGFSLVEMLVVIAVIGVIAAIAIPNISSLTSTATDAKDKRNAQNIASIYSTARVAGYNFAYDTGDPSGTALSTAAEVIDAIEIGATVSGGSLDGTLFAVPNLAADEKAGALNYLVLEDGSLIFGD